MHLTRYFMRFFAAMRNFSKSLSLLQQIIAFPFRNESRFLQLLSDSTYANFVRHEIFEGDWTLDQLSKEELLQVGQFHRNYRIMTPTEFENAINTEGETT